jgi:CBS domain-containing protein
MHEEAIRNARIRHLKLQPPLTMPSGTPLREVLGRMQSARQTCVLICNDKKCVGIFTERDFLNKILLQKVELSRPVDEWMSPQPKTLTLEDSVDRAISLMQQFGYRNIPLVDAQGNTSGLVQIRNIVDFLAETFPQEVLNKPPRDQTFPSPDGA